MRIKAIAFILLFVLNLQAQERIVSLSPSITEILFALGKGENIVGTSSYSNYPPEAKKLPAVGAYSQPHFEKILALLPSLVIGQTFNQRTLEKLKKFKIKTLQVNLKTLTNITDSISLMAREVGSTKDKELVRDITNAITKHKKAKNPHSVMIVYGLREDLRNATYIAGHNIFFEDIIESCGHTNAYTANSTRQPVLNYENIIAINPDQIIILHSQATQANVNVKKALEGWYKLPTNAAKNRNISIVNKDYIHIPSHRVALSIDILRREMNQYNLP